jgi:dienelactone hydrolase
MKLNAILLTTLFMAPVAHAELRGKTVDYKEGKAALSGYVVFDDAVQGKRPGVVVIPDWMGPSDFTKDRADMLARMGYVAVVADIYGKNVRPKDASEAKAQVAIYKGNRPLLRARAKAALDLLLAQKETDPARTAAIGYCFGGTAALELARSGAPLTGLVTFHGGLDTPTPQDAKNIKAKVLVLAGADDPFVPAEQRTAFEKEMKDGNVADWQMVSYSGAVHAFAVPSAGNDPSKGAAYNARADHRSWQAMKDFFVEIFNATPSLKRQDNSASLSQ